MHSAPLKTSGNFSAKSAEYIAPMLQPVATMRASGLRQSARMKGTSVSRMKCSYCRCRAMRCSSGPSPEKVCEMLLSGQYSLRRPAASQGPSASTMPLCCHSWATPALEGKTMTGRPTSPKHQT